MRHTIPYVLRALCAILIILLTVTACSVGSPAETTDAASDETTDGVTAANTDPAPNETTTDSETTASDPTSESTTAEPTVTTAPEDETTIPDPAPPSPTYTKLALNNTATWVKLLSPRMEATAEHITCDWSASGIEFTATFGGDVTFEVHATTYPGGDTEGCYFRAYVDGAAYKNGNSDYYTVKEGNSEIVLKNVPKGTHTVRLVKVTGYTLANAELKSVSLSGTVQKAPPAQKDLLIEFVGDSMSCGWGVVGNYDGAYTAQDATLAFPYLIATALNADCSVVALSGQGIIKGTPGIANGYRYSSPNRSKATEYAFHRKADVVVINADTNDAYSNYATATYLEALGNFVKYVREKNGADTHIILVANMMKTLYTDAIANYVKGLGGADNRYYFYRATTAEGVHTAHPTAEEHITYAAELGAMIDSILDGTYSDEEKTPTIPTNAVPVYTQNFNHATNATDAGVSNLYGGTKAPTVTDGKLCVPKMAWGDKPFLELVGRDVFRNAPGKYMVSMDLDVTELNNLSIVLNGTADAAADTSYKRKGASIVQIKVRKEGSTADIKGTPANFNDGNSFIVIRHGYFAATDGTQNMKDNSTVYARPIEKNASSLSFRLTVIVDSTPTNGCDILVFVDDAYVTTYHLGNEYDVTANSSVYLWAENTVTTVDNLTVSKIES